MSVLIVCLCVSLIFAANAVAKPSVSYPEEEDCTEGEALPEEERNTDGGKCAEETEQNKKPMGADCTP